MKPGTTPIDTGTTQEPDGNHWGTSGRSGTPHTLKECGGRNHSAKKFATKQAKNREVNRRRKLAKHHRSGAKHSPETIERIRATRIAQIAEKQREAAQPEPCRVPCSAVELYRATVAERRPIIAAREAKIMQHVKEAVDAADARAHELRHRGRPKNTHRLPPLFIRKSPDALIAAVSDWHGER